MHDKSTLPSSIINFKNGTDSFTDSMTIVAPQYEVDKYELLKVRMYAVLHNTSAVDIYDYALEETYGTYTEVSVALKPCLTSVFALNSTQTDQFSMVVDQNVVRDKNQLPIGQDNPTIRLQRKDFNFTNNCTNLNLSLSYELFAVEGASEIPLNSSDKYKNVMKFSNKT